MKNYNSIIIWLLSIIILGILWSSMNKYREGLDEPPPPSISADDAKELASSFKQQMAAAGIPQVNSSDMTNLFDELSSLVSQEVTAMHNTVAQATEDENNTPAVNTVVPPIPFPDTSFFMGSKFGDAFCSVNNDNPTSLNQKCSTLTSENCNATDCCIWANGSKCVAGDARGPTYINGVSADADYYSYKYQCYGNCGGLNEQRVYGNNGSVSCNTYCAGTGGKSWNNELPPSWAGAKCKTAGANDDQDCNRIAGSTTQCVCQRSDNTPYA
jgi:hypothetical protein